MDSSSDGKNDGRRATRYQRPAAAILSGKQLHALHPSRCSRHSSRLAIDVYPPQKRSVHAPMARTCARLQRQGGHTHCGTFCYSGEEALLFVAQSPLSCPLYDTGKDKDLQQHLFRRCNVHTFPHAVFFRLENTHVFVELL
jgi:hypothetical protein